MKKKKDGLKLSDIIIILIVCFIGYKFFVNKDVNSEEKNTKKNEEYNRTILMYISPANLESDGGNISHDLAAISTSKFDFEHNTLLVLAGGANKWYNDFSKDTTLYKFTENGFVVEEEFDNSSKNMGDPNTLAMFLDYATDKYKSDYNYFFFEGHGSGVSGIMYDEVYDDLLSLDELISVFSYSHVKQFDIIAFTSCLASNIEMINTLRTYAKYMIASEEDAWSTNISVFQFLNDVDKSVDTIEFGKMYVDSYKRSVENSVKGYNLQMGMIDPTRVGVAASYLNDLFKRIDIDKDYEDILKIRLKMNQFGYDEKSFDEVDLYDLMEKLYDYDKESVKNFIRKFKDGAVIYNYSNRSFMHGVSVHFPVINNDDDFIPDLPVYLKYANTPYYSFIREFVERQGYTYFY